MDKEIEKLIKRYVNQGMSLENILDEQLDSDDPLRKEYVRVYELLYPSAPIIIHTPIKKRGRPKKIIDIEPNNTESIKNTQHKTKNNPTQPINTKKEEEKKEEKKEGKKEYTTTELRDYQKLTVDKCQLVFKSGATRCFVKLPTGAGKTRVMYKLIDDDYNLYMKKIELQGISPAVYLCLSPRIQLADQHFNDDKIMDLNTCCVVLKIHTEQTNQVIKQILDKWQSELINGKYQALIISGLYQSISRIRTILSQYPVIKSINLLFADEAHMISTLGSVQKISNDVHTRWLMLGTFCKRRIFLSATPTELQSQNNSGYWGELINPVSIRALILRNILCPIETIIPNVSINSTSNLSATRANNIDDINNDAFCDIIYKSIEIAKTQKNIVFCNTQKKCRDLYNCFAKICKSNNFSIQPYLFIGNGFSSDNITSLDNDVSEHKIRGDIVLFESSKIPSVVFVCRKISMGYDFPPIDLIAFADPKCSSADIAQCIGRGLRSSPGKNKCRVMIPITPYDYENNTLARQKHNTLFQYLLYLQDEVGFEFKIPNSNEVYNISTGKRQPSISPPTEDSTKEIISFVGSGIPNINYIDLTQIYVRLDIKPIANNIINTQSNKQTESKPKNEKPGCRDITKCLIDGQKIRHRIGKEGEHIVYGCYSSLYKTIIVNSINNIIYMSLNEFAKRHYEAVKPERQSNVNAWRECEIEKKGEWHSIYSLPELPLDSDGNRYDINLLNKPIGCRDINNLLLHGQKIIHFVPDGDNLINIIGRYNQQTKCIEDDITNNKYIDLEKFVMFNHFVFNTKIDKKLIDPWNECCVEIAHNKFVSLYSLLAPKTILVTQNKQFICKNGYFDSEKCQFVKISGGIKNYMSSCNYILPTDNTNNSNNTSDSYQICCAKLNLFLDNIIPNYEQKEYILNLYASKFEQINKGPISIICYSGNYRLIEKLMLLIKYTFGLYNYYRQYFTFCNNLPYENNIRICTYLVNNSEFSEIMNQINTHNTASKVLFNLVNTSINFMDAINANYLNSVALINIPSNSNIDNTNKYEIKLLAQYFLNELWERYKIIKTNDYNALKVIPHFVSNNAIIITHKINVINLFITEYTEPKLNYIQNINEFWDEFLILLTKYNTENNIHFDFSKVDFIQGIAHFKFPFQFIGNAKFLLHRTLKNQGTQMIYNIDKISQKVIVEYCKSLNLSPF